MGGRYGKQRTEGWRTKWNEGEYGMLGEQFGGKTERLNGTFERVASKKRKGGERGEKGAGNERRYEEVLC